MNQNRTEQIRENNAETITWILGATGEAKEKIKSYIMDQGIKSFLLHHKQLELATEEDEKIDVLKRVIKTFDGDIETMNFSDMDEGC
ncbi:hypothetical protein [Alkaliphilus serpentinus]|uniref:Uncharacterized protein n=1 Tax=Alkaliphilus serpentinus TaxID=1482731 RepID=A0A833HM10_9FIRM|nr:hypothetical protein [Alkaliphilus serpentinus]KAB3527103.1 hypothetical protein F8153_13080 [Alkaliphilus serpentinus]